MYETRFRHQCLRTGMRRKAAESYSLLDKSRSHLEVLYHVESPYRTSRTYSNYSVHGVAAYKPEALWGGGRDV
jgi:hypothetical protein